MAPREDLETVGLVMSVQITVCMFVGSVADTVHLLHCKSLNILSSEASINNFQLIFSAYKIYIVEDISGENPNSESKLTFLNLNCRLI